MQASALSLIALVACGGAAGPGSKSGDRGDADGSGSIEPSIESGPDRVEPPTGPRGLEGADVAGTGEHALDLRFQIRTHSGGEARYIAPGDQLTSGDQLEMFIEIDQAAHVYVVQFFADETTAVLFPKGEASAHLHPGRHRIPAAGKMFELDDSTGDEHVYVVASRQPLEDVDSDIAASVAEVRVSGAGSPAAGGDKPRPINPKKPRRARNKPRLLSLGNRGLSRVSHSTGQTPAVSARGDSDGVVVFRFWFVHR